MNLPNSRSPASGTPRHSLIPFSLDGEQLMELKRRGGLRLAAASLPRILPRLSRRLWAVPRRSHSPLPQHPRGNTQEDGGPGARIGECDQSSISFEATPGDQPMATTSQASVKTVALGGYPGSEAAAEVPRVPRMSFPVVLGFHPCHVGYGLADLRVRSVSQQSWQNMESQPELVRTNPASLH
ncbi:hypothetical protein LZ31DRAFT_560304 [Colletotrichum somersetense]|nr:hypothetical protein LZ31DRAFT_560304 [Colletotrichum somersetense]